jgi:RimJ/RimL family protein N-acetyltransferase
VGGDDQQAHGRSARGVERQAPGPFELLRRGLPRELGGPAQTGSIGYWIGEPYWNRGFATEAASALTERAKARFGGESIVSGHYADNHASGRVLTKLGFRYTGEESRWCEARQEKAHCLTMKLMRVEA